MNYKRIALYIWVYIVLPVVVFAGNAEIWIERTDMNPSRLVYIGDEIQFSIMVDTEGEDITGVAAYITIDPEFLQPVFPGNLKYGKPFKPGRFLETNDAVINNTHLDSLHLFDQPGWGNGLDGFQLDYYQSTGPVVNGSRPSARGMGVVATFKLRVVGMPDNANDSTAIAFDFKNDDNRLTTYYKLDEPSNEQRFRKFMNYSMFIAGFRIYPDIPDTLIPPGSTLDVNLNEHVTSNSDNYEISWSMTEMDALNGAVPTLDDTLVNVTTTPLTKGVLKLRVTGVQKNTNYVDSQEFTVGVDHVPEFHDNIPTVTFNEDEVIMLSKSYFFSDQDDAFEDISVIPGSSNLLIEDAGDSIKFSAARDWFGNSSAILVVRDPVQQIINDSTSAEISINVLPVNDPPVLNLSELDPIPVFYGVTKYITMENGLYVVDVDDETFEWSVESMDTEHLAASFTDNILTLEGLLPQFVGNVEIKVTVMDDENALDSARVNVYIQPMPVKLLPIPQIILISGQSKDIHLNDYVDYPNDIKSELFWSFEVMNERTKQVDTDITLSYNSEQQILSISSTAGHLAIDELYVTVSAGNENQDSGKTLLKVISQNYISIFPFPEVTIMQGMDLDVLDLTDYVVDPIYSIDDIDFSYTGGDSLKAVNIDANTNIITISADTVFLGTDSLTIVATNPDGDKAYQQLRVTCIEYNPYPVFMSPLPDAYYYWRTLTPQLYVDLDDYIWDFATPDSSIIWRIDYNHIAMDIVQTEDNVVKISTFNQIGDQVVIFSATNYDGYTTSDTVIVTIAKRGEPVWRNIPPIDISSGQVYSSLYLNRFCLTGGHDVRFSANFNIQELNISINSTSSQVFISSVNGFSGTSPVVFYATNEDTSSLSNLVNVNVSQKSSVTCFFNSIVSNRVNFVVNTDKAVSNMNYHLLLNSVEQSLSFRKIDSTATQKIWMAPFTLEKSGLYKLNLDFSYSNGLLVTDSLWLSTQLGSDLGKALATQDNFLIVDPVEKLGKNDVMILSQDEIELYDDPRVQPLYTLLSNRDDFTGRVKANPEDRTGSYNWAFYIVKGQDVVEIETTTDGQGSFYATMEMNTPFVFMPSSTPAVEEYVLKDGIASYPNPFNSQVKVRYLIEKEHDCTINIFNLLGQRVLARKTGQLTRGIHEFTWSSINQYGNPVPSGLYFIRIQTGNKILTHKVLLIR